MKRFYVGEPRQPGEGLRIGAIRYAPRGIEKEDYARENWFDVWLPVLAPSRRLMARAKPHQKDCNPKFWHWFFESYEREMRDDTNARQTIEMLAKLPRSTRVSVGCRCPAGSWCHATVLLRLIEEARERQEKGLRREVKICKAGRGRLYSQCVYTLVDPEKLEAIAGKSGSHWLERGREWVTADDLLQEAMFVRQRVPILFGNPRDVSELLYWGLLESTDEDDGEKGFWVSKVRALRGRKPQDVVKVSNGKRIRPGYRRAYVIGRTPGFLKG